MRLLVVLLLFTNNLFADYSKVYEINNIEVPHGIIATYDELEEFYLISTKSFYPYEGTGFFGGMGLYNNISMSFTYPQNTTPSITISLQTLFEDTCVLLKLQKFIDINHVDIYIKNEKNHKFSIPIPSKNMIKNTFIISSKYGASMTTEIHENFKVLDPKFFDFLLANLNQDSEIVMRFKNTNSSKTISIDVRKREIKALLKMIEFYNHLVNNIIPPQEEYSPIKQPFQPSILFP